MAKQISLILWGFFCILFMSLPQVVTQSQSEDCNSGVFQRLEVGGQGQVIPGQTRNRMRTVPGGDQVGFVEVGEVFTVIDGPECNDNISWWQVTTSSGLTGWTAEGVDGEAFLEPVASQAPSGGGGGNQPSQTATSGSISISFDGSTGFDIDQIVGTKLDLRLPVPRSNDACDNAPNWTLGQRVRISASELPDVFYGHPMIPDRLYSGYRHMQHAVYLTQVSPDFIMSDVEMFLDKILYKDYWIIEGPVCFSGSWMWKIQDTEGFGRTNGPVTEFPSYWIFEQVEDRILLSLSENQIPTLPAFTPSIYMLNEQDSAPIVSALEQLEFGFGGGPGPFFLLDWEVAGCGLGAGDDLSVTQYRQNKCMTIYPFIPDDMVNVTIIQPDGAPYKEYQIKPKDLTVDLYYDLDPNHFTNFTDTFTIYGIDIELEDEPGLMAGVWQIEAQQGETIIHKAYHLDRPTDQVLMPVCDGTAVEYWFGNLPANTDYDAIVYQASDETVITEDSTELVVFHEVARWTINSGSDGHAILRGAIQIPESGILSIAEVGNVPKVVTARYYFDDYGLRNMYPVICSAPSSVNNPITIQPDQLYTNSFENDDTSRIHYYTFYGHAGDTVSIRMTQVTPDYEMGFSEDRRMDSYLQLLSPDGQLLAEDDNSANDSFLAYDAEISNVTLTGDGFYTIIAQDLVTDARSINPYALQLQTTNTDNTLGLGVPIQSVFEGDTTSYTFFGRAEDVITISARSDNFDIRVQLIKDGDILADDDDSGDSFLDARIQSFDLPESGLYTIEISSWNDKQGTYTLEITNE